MSASPVDPVEAHDLVITRTLRAAPRAVAPTDPELLKQWWCPKP